MMTIRSQQAGLIGLILSPMLLALSAFLTHAGPRRIGGALVAGLLLMPFVFAWDALAARAGWWRYPSPSASHGPPAYYITAGLWYGAGVGLIAWRVVRRFDARGLVGFLAAFAPYGVTRDYAGAKGTGLIAFAPGLAPAIADAMAWASGGALVQLVMHLVAGPARADALARGQRGGREAG